MVEKPGGTEFHVHGYVDSVVGARNMGACLLGLEIGEGIGWDDIWP